MPIDPRELRPAAPPEQILGDLKCRKCDYNLRGLKTTDKCPECGTLIRKPSSRLMFKDRMSSAPFPWLKRYALATMLLFFGALIFGVSAFAWAAVQTSIAGMATLASTLVWYAGVWLSTHPRPDDKGRMNNPQTEWSTMRLAARVSQPFLALAVIAVLTIQYLDSAHWLLFLSATICSVITIAGWTPLLIIQSNLAYWASDTTLSDKLRNCCWAAAIGAILGLGFTLSISFGVLGGAFRVLLSSMIVGGAVLFTIGYTYITLFQLWRMAHWVVINSAIEAARTDRLRAKAERAASPRP